MKNHTIVVSKVTTLDHKVLDNTVEARTLISEALLASSKSTKPMLLGDIVRKSMSGDRIKAYRKFSAVCNGAH